MALPDQFLTMLPQLRAATKFQSEQVKRQELTRFFSLDLFQNFSETPPNFQMKPIHQLKEEVFRYVLYRLSYVFKNMELDLDTLNGILFFIEDIIKIENKFNLNSQELLLEYDLSLLYFCSLTLIDQDPSFTAIRTLVKFDDLMIMYNSNDPTPEDTMLTEIWETFRYIIQSNSFTQALTLLTFCITKSAAVP